MTTPTSIVRRAPLVPGLRFLRMLWRMLPPLAVSGVVVAAAYLFDASEGLRQQAWIVAAAITGFSLLGALFTEILSPHRPSLRLIAMKDHRAERLVAVARTLLLVLLGTEVAIYLVNANGWNPAAARFLGLLRNLGLILFTGSALSRMGLFRRIKPAVVDSYGSLFRWLIVRVLYPLAWITAMFLAVVFALGYRVMGEWVLRGSAWTAVVIVGAAFVYRFLRLRLQRMVAFLQAEEDDAAEDEAAGNTEALVGHEEAPIDEDDTVWSWAQDLEKDDEAAPPPPPPSASPTWIGVERIGAGALKILVLLVSFFILLGVWELDTVTLQRILAKPIVAGWAATWGSVASGFAKVAGILLLGAFLRNLLIFIILPRAKVEAGARYAILAILRYTIGVLALLFGFSALGFDTSALAVFAGAFGVGLAFGLQDIFGNFFAGLIMLLERPVRVGDTIDVSGASGRVEAIKLRGTTLRTSEGTTIIIPNRAMIGERLSNLSHNIPIARVEVSVGVGYDSEPRKVERILMRVARRDGRVLTEPAPHVRFQAFGESSLDFVLRCYTDQPGDRFALGSDLRREVFAAFKHEGIEIPFPQRDLNFPGGMPGLES